MQNTMWGSHILKTSPTGLKLIKSFEWFSANAYNCPAGYQTIGYGHVMKPDAAFSHEISETKALELLAQDISNAEQAIHRLIRVPLT